MASDAFTADDSDTSTSGTTLSSTTEYKYAQIEVPSFQVDAATFNTSAGGTTTAAAFGGNSFLRLGSSAVATSVQNNATSMSPNTSDAPTGFSDSLTLAKLVGDIDSISSAETTDDSSPDSSNILRSNPYAGSKLVGFADDTRVRDTTNEDVYLNKTTIDNLTSNRKTETKRLLTKGGWWDHSDGNRVTTTAGDKLEVIQGNYKLVVLGRQAATSSTGRTSITDISGGITASKTYEWVKTESGTMVWSTFEESSKAYATKKTSGVEVTYFTGTKKETIIGKDPDIKTVGDFFNKADFWTDDDGDPEVISKTWAQKIETYVGSVGKPVPHVLLVTYADFMEDIRTCVGTHLTARTGAVVAATNTAIVGFVSAMNLSTTGTITINAAPLSLLLNFFAQTWDIRTGHVTSVNTTRTDIYGNATSFKGGEQVVAMNETKINAIKTDVNNYAARVALEATNVGLAQNNMAASIITNSTSVNSMALQHNFI